MNFRRLFLVIGIGLGACAARAEVDFNRDIRPIISDHCFACHGPDQHERKGGKRGQGLRLDTPDGARADLGGYAAIVPGHPPDSALIKRIFSTDPEDLMPPPDHHKPLKPAQKSLLEQWIREGGDYAAHWAFMPPKRPAGDRIDAFVRRRLEAEGLAPAPKADARTLLRRLSFDLTGLPPRPEALEAFLKDPTRYEQQVDRLLASPHFGERLAAYWLDLVRYADSNGYHADLEWSVSPYRDYVIRAFNNNMPFDRFTREQLGGDLLPNASLDQQVAAGFNRLNMKSTEFGIQDKEYLAKYAGDRVRTVAGVWLGATLGCAECHDHKFDPFTSADFYRFAAFFADIKQKGYYAGAQKQGWGERISVPDPADERKIAELEALKVALKKNVEAHAPPKVNWQVLHPDHFDAEQGNRLKKLDDGSILAGGKTFDHNSYTLQINKAPAGITAIRIEALPHKSLPKGGPGRASNGNFVITEIRVFAGDQPVKLVNPSATFEQTHAGQHTPYKVWNAESAIDGDQHGGKPGWAVLPEINKPQAAVFETNADIGGALKVIIEQKHGTRHELGRFRLSVTTAPRPVHAVEAKSPVQKKIDDLDEQIKQLRDRAPTMLATVSVKPMTMRVLPRGNWMDTSGAVVEPGVPGFMKQLGTKERASRLDLADWLVDPENPLTARVFVNRLWKVYFGTGLSKVLDDLGAQGEAPTHPELLDWLAVEFIESGWDIKHLVKLMVMSDTYRQSSLPREELKRDPYNRLLARQSRFRLDAEMIRDNALAVSGLLMREVGGQSVKPYQPEGYWDHLYFPKRIWKHDTGERQYRRAVYTHWQRQFLHPALKIFDAPSREECTAERPRSNTPLGALALLNDPSQVEAARVLAGNALAVAKEDMERLQWIGTRVLSRPFKERELEVLSNLLRAHRAHFESDVQAAEELLNVGLHPVSEDFSKPEQAAWTSVTRSVLNMHETITRN